MASHEVKNEADAQEQSFKVATTPRTRVGNSIVSVDDVTGPFCCCPTRMWFYPTHAVITTTDEHDAEQSYVWNSRSHRKMRYPSHIKSEDSGKSHHPIKISHRFHLLSYEPYNVTWYICWIGVIANTLWVVNGLYAVWPELAQTDMGAITITYYTGTVGAFLFIVTGYLGYVEAINHTHDEVRIPSADTGSNRPNNRQIRRQPSSYGVPYHPLGFALSKEKSKLLKQIIQQGYPVVQDDITGHIVTSRLFNRFLENCGDIETMEEQIKGRLLNLQLGEHIFQVRIESLQTNPSNSYREISNARPEESNYIWWTKDPDLHNIGIVNALVFFISTIIFWIPALAWWPMDTLGKPDLASEIFWVYVLQIIPSLGFIYVGHAAMAEASGSWMKPDFDNIGWWVSFFNTIDILISMNFLQKG